MDPETLFSICQNAVLPGWLLLVVAPRWKWTAGLISSVILPGLMAVIYIYLIATNIGNTEGSFGTLAGVAQFFENRNLLLAGWVHYLAFDLFVGAWEVRDSQRVGVRHWFVIPCLVMTLLLGPAGLLLYFVIRTVKTRRLLIGSDHS